MNERKFDGKAEAYAAARPSYPPDLMDMLFDASGAVGMFKNCAVADVGSGPASLPNFFWSAARECLR
ncbi:MAG: hypothetical protein LBC13_00040 [Clostridiales bacterium]|nr:hypothetical protein [Clostridiales bacterium]